MWTTTKVRQQFLDYFAQHDHHIVPSSSLVPNNDPTLLFTNAGMVQFKNYFTGVEKANLTRLASAQKCVRAGGKHNDLENVGYTARHHTFFEMLGNFSLGDYFKAQAIEMAWELITRVFAIPAERLLITVYAEDEEATILWRKISNIAEDRIIKITGNDNFWSMGESGPCGPCSEIFYDYGEHIVGGPPGSPNQDGDRFVEIWNLVFMQYDLYTSNDNKAGQYTLLPKPSIDTGAGLERLATVLQGVHNNYDIDLFKNLIQKIVEITGITAKGQNLNSFRVIADHLRCSCFLIADGVMPANEGRGYVLRRILRRAMRHVDILNYSGMLMHQLVSTLIEEMGSHYTELEPAKALIIETLKCEEERFKETLKRGLRVLNDELAKLSSSSILSGQAAFKLYDTYGFPLDLTQDILRSEGRQVDIASFQAAMAEQKAKSRAHWVGSGSSRTEDIWWLLNNKLAKTEFIGYENTRGEGIIQALLTTNSEECLKLTTGQEGWAITNKTPFYAEAGGQLGDIGGMINDAGSHIKVLDTVKKTDNLIVHSIKIEDGELKLGDQVRLIVNNKRQQLLKANHTATHLLHATLRKHLGPQVVQKGSLVEPRRLRFDFSSSKPLTYMQLQAIEDEINDIIRSNLSTAIQLMNIDQALATGAIALFGEKYNEQVRVVTIGKDQQDGTTVSVELCGGTHVKSTGEIGLFKIINENSIAAGIRRIEALTGLNAELHLREKMQLIQQLSDILKTSEVKLLQRAQQLVEDNKSLENQVKALKQSSLLTNQSDRHSQTKLIQGITFFTQTLADISAKELRPRIDDLKQQLKSAVIVLATIFEEKATIIIGVTADLTSQISAIDLAKVAVQSLGGRGSGGKPEFAQAGGPKIQYLFRALADIEKAIEHTVAF